MLNLDNKQQAQKEKILFLKLHDTMDLFKEDLEVLKDMVDKYNNIDEIQAIDYKIEEINEALNDPLKLFLSNDWSEKPKFYISNELNSYKKESEIETVKEKEQYTRNDIRNWVNKLKQDSSDCFDEELKKAIELSRIEIYNNDVEDDIELQLALELSKNERDQLFDSLKIKTIDN